jgi:hypothetical protein
MIYGDELAKKIKALKDKPNSTAEEKAALKAYQDSFILYLKCKDEEIRGGVK